MIFKLKNARTKIVFISIFVFSVILQTLFVLSESFSEFYTIKVCGVLKYIFIPISVIPFSLAECIVIIFSILFITAVSLFLFHLICRIIKKEFTTPYKAIFVLLLKLAIIVFFLFTITFSSSYHRLDVAKSMNLSLIEPNKETITIAAEKVLEDLIIISKEVEYEKGTFSSSKMSFKELSKALKLDADKASKKYPFINGTGSVAKPLVTSKPMTWTHIAGIYAFFTGEPCINTNYAPYTLPYTIAHEYAHQRGIGPENEAEFVAYLIASESCHPYVRYSAAAEAFVSLANELYELDPAAHQELISRLPDVVINDFLLEHDYYSKYSDSPIEDAVTDANDAYLKLNGVESGIKSYSESIILLVSYLNKK